MGALTGAGLPPKLRGDIRRALRGTPGPRDIHRLAQGIRAADPVIKGEPLSHWLGLIRQERDPHWLSHNSGLQALEEAGPWLLPLWLDLIYRERPGHATRGGLIALARHPHPAALPALNHALKSEHGGLRFGALMALSALTPLPAGFVPKLLKATREDNRKIAYAALRALRWQGLDAAMIGPVYARGLDHGDEDVRREAAQGLGTLGAAARPYLPALQAYAARGQGPDARGLAALGQIDPDLVLHKLLDGLLKGRSWMDNSRSLEALARIDARAGLPRLLKALPSHWAIAALGQMGAAAIDALPSLREISARDPQDPLLYGAIRDIERGATFPARFISHQAPRSSASPARLLSQIASRGAHHSLAALQALAYEAVHLWDEAYPLDSPPRCVVEAFDRWLEDRTPERIEALKAESSYGLTQGTSWGPRCAVDALNLIAREAPINPRETLPRVYEKVLEALSFDPGQPFYRGDAFDPPPRHVTAQYLAYVLENITPLGG